MMKRWWLLLAVVAGVLVSAVGGTSQPRKQQVYMFGFAASFADSLCVMTEVNPVEAYVMPNGFLADRSLYSLQLNNYLVAEQKRDGLTCVVYFDKNRAKLEKKFQKIRRRYRNDASVVLQQLGAEEFRFEGEEWIAPEVTAEEPQDSLKATPVQATKDKKKKSKKKA